MRVSFISRAQGACAAGMTHVCACPRVFVSRCGYFVGVSVFSHFFHSFEVYLMFEEPFNSSTVVTSVDVHSHNENKTHHETDERKH